MILLKLLYNIENLKIVVPGIIILCLYSQPAVSGTIKIDENLTKVHIGLSMEYLVDEGGKLGIKELASAPDEKWLPSKKEAPGFGFTKSAYWVRFNIQNTTQNKATFFLEQGFPHIDWLTLYYKNKDGFKSILVGDHKPFSLRPYNYRTFIFPLSQKGNSVKSYYLRYQTESGMNLDLRLWSPNSFKEAASLEYRLLMLLYGIILVMIIYNLFIYFFIRKKEYLYYVIFCTFYFLFMLTLNGTAFQYLWPDSPWWANFCIPVFLSLTILSVLQFIFELADLKKQNTKILRVAFRLNKNLSLINLFVLALCIFLPYMYAMIISSIFAGIVLLILLVYALILSFREHHRQARFALIATFPLLLGSLLFFSKAFGMLPTNFITEWMIHIGSVFMVVAFSIALADRINTMRRELTFSRDKLMELTESLEAKVEERTKRLKETQLQLIETAHQAGMADIASSILHNIGNTLNSITISTEEINSLIKRSKIEDLVRAGEIIKDNEKDIAAFFSKDPKGKQLLQYYKKVPKVLITEQAKLKHEMEQLEENINIVKETIEKHTEYAGTKFLTERIELISIIDDAIKVQSNEFRVQGLKIQKNYSEDQEIFISGQKTKLMYVLLNLFKNASESIGRVQPENRIISIDLNKYKDFVKLEIFDNGEGINKRNLKKIFNYGFTTKAGSHGFGLHICANLISEMKGKIYAESGGQDKGATFILNMPLME